MCLLHSLSVWVLKLTLNLNIKSLTSKERIIFVIRKAVLTLMHRHREKGSVAIIRRIDTRASNRAQHPGPSGSAGKIKQV